MALLQSFLIFFGVLWAVHAALAMLVVAPAVWFTRARINWHRWELTEFILPFAAWAALQTYRPKSLSNFNECVFISGAIAVAALLRVVLARRADNGLVAALLIAAVLAFAVGVYFVTPVWPSTDSI